MVSEFSKADVTIPPTTPEDVRLGALLHEEVLEEEPTIVLLGFPSDEGVRRNGGRPGASLAPDAIRQDLYKFTPDPIRVDGFTRLLTRGVDLGNLRSPGTMEAHQEVLGNVLGPYLGRGAVPIIIGGGHETSFGHFLGYVVADRPIAILNWDAHTDVRPLRDGKGHSGSPFRQALEHPSGLCRAYAVAGLLPHSVARSHLDYVTERGGAYTWRRDLTRERITALYEAVDQPVFVTFDVDAVDAAFAPGVSAPAAGGMTPEIWLHAAYEAGRCPFVTSIDLVEVNPRFDVDGRTTRLAALTIWSFLRGLTDRYATTSV